MASWSRSTTSSGSTTSTKQTGTSQSTSKSVLDQELLAMILGGLTGGMTQEEIGTYAAQLLTPQKNAALAAARQAHEVTRLTKEQEIENLAAELAGSIAAQNSAYRQNMADVQNAALARGMGRSSYTLETLARQGDALSQAVLALTQENETKSAQLREQIAKSAEHSESERARIEQDYASQMAAKIQELTREQQKTQNANYLTAVSASMGKETTGTSESASQSQTHSQSTTTKTSGKTGSSSSSGKKKKEEEEIVDAVSSAAVSTSRWK